MTYRSTHIEIYACDVHLATTKREWRALAKRIGQLDAAPPDSAGASTFSAFRPNSGGITRANVILWVDAVVHAREQPGELIDTIAHEASHAANQLMEHIGHDSSGVDEPSAYLTGWLARWMWEQLTDNAAGQS